MAKFTDLIFGAHPVFANATQAHFDFPNGYGISVVTGQSAYTSPAQPYEAAVTLNGAWCGKTHITNSVLGHQTVTDIDKLMAQVEALPKPKE